MIAEACIVEHKNRAFLKIECMYCVNTVNQKMKLIWKCLQMSVIFWLFFKVNIFVIYNDEKSVKLSGNCKMCWKQLKYLKSVLHFLLFVREIL